MNTTPDYSKNIIIIKNKSDFNLVPADKFTSTTKHILIACNYDLIANKIEQLCKEESVYSVLSLDHSKNLERLAQEIDAVPIFFVSSNDECFDIVKTLVDFPFNGIKKALNHEAVAIRYLEGHPS